MVCDQQYVLILSNEKPTYVEKVEILPLGCPKQGVWSHRLCHWLLKVCPLWIKKLTVLSFMVIQSIQWPIYAKEVIKQKEIRLLQHVEEVLTANMCNVKDRYKISRQLPNVGENCQILKREKNYAPLQ